MIAIIHGPSEQALIALQKELSHFRMEKAQQYVHHLKLSAEARRALACELRAQLKTE